MLEQGKDVKEEDKQMFVLCLEEQKRKLEQQIEASKPNVLIYGMSGAGKSSLINRLFGEELAEVGVGEPVTDGFYFYTSDSLKLNLYDSKGLELGNPRDAQEKTRVFLANLERKKTPIHMIWYVISVPAARVQGFEQEIITTQFSGYPLIIVLSKKDAGLPGQVEDLTRLCAGLDHCLGVYPITTVEPVPDKKFETCPMSTCRSDDLSTNQKHHRVRCETCSWTASSLGDSGLEELVEGTTKQLPAMVASSFHIAQQITLEYQDQRAKEILKTLWDTNEHLGYGKEYSSIFISMLAELGVLFNLNLTGKQIGVILSEEEACNLFTSALYTTMDTVRQLFGKETTARLFITAKAVYWYRRLRAAKIDLILDRLKEVKLSSYDAEQNQVAAIQSCIESEGLQAVLDEKLPTLKELRAQVGQKK